MSDNTKIEWTDATWNLINGCTVLSPGCTNCYAMRWAHRLQNNPSPTVAESRAGLTKVVNGKPVWTGDVLFNRALALKPFQWKRPRKIFVCAHGDLFHENVKDQWIDYVFMVALLNPRHTFQILTKRAARMREYMQMVEAETEEQTAGRFAIAMLHGGLMDMPADQLPDIEWPPRNVWLGTSVEDQKRADERIPLLLQTPAAVRWLSCEPLLGPVDLSPWTEWEPSEQIWSPGGGSYTTERVPNSIDWVVAGGESGPGARPMQSAWARSLRDQCVQAGVAFHFKQWGDWWPLDHASEEFGLSVDESRAMFTSETTDTHAHIGKTKAGRELDGRTWDEYPDRGAVPTIAGGVCASSSPAQISGVA